RRGAVGIELERDGGVDRLRLRAGIAREAVLDRGQGVRRPVRDRRIRDLVVVQLRGDAQAAARRRRAALAGEHRDAAPAALRVGEHLAREVLAHARRRTEVARDVMIVAGAARDRTVRVELDDDTGALPRRDAVLDALAQIEAEQRAVALVVRAVGDT